MAQRPALDDPRYAAFAWARYRRILGWMALVSLVAAVATVLLLWRTVAEFNFHVALASFLAVFLTMLLTAALMGLIFLSSGSGHDEQVDELTRSEGED